MHWGKGVAFTIIYSIAPPTFSSDPTPYTVTPSNHRFTTFKMSSGSKLTFSELDHP